MTKDKCKKGAGTSPSLSFSTKFGWVTVTEEEGNIAGVSFRKRRKGKNRIPSRILIRAKREISNYLGGHSKKFSLPYNLRGVSAHTRKVLEFLHTIPHGRVTSYGAIARKLRTSPRAVGQACKRNPLPLIIPCHRVIGGNGSLTGFSAGVSIKKSLLELEKVKNPAQG